MLTLLVTLDGLLYNVQCLQVKPLHVAEKCHTHNMYCNSSKLMSYDMVIDRSLWQSHPPVCYGGGSMWQIKLLFHGVCVPLLI